MRYLGTTLSGSLFPFILQAQSLLINELQAAGEPGDLVEILNTSDRSIDLGGYALFLNGLHHRIVPPLPIAPHGFLVLSFDRDTDAGNDQIGLKLPREGATLLLIAADGSTILDAFTYPPLPDGVSTGRVKDGGRTIGYYAVPTWGTSNLGSIAARRLLAPPMIEVVALDPDSAEVRMGTETGTQICYALDGQLPDPLTSARYDGPFAVDPDRPIVAMAFADDAIASAPSCRTPGSLHSAEVPQVHLVVAPRDLVDPDRGIDVEGSHGNYAQRGKEWERNAFLQCSGEVQSRPVRISIAGSGSRSYPKRSFKIRSVDGDGFAFPIAGRDIAQQHALVLRADASPHAFLRDLFMAQAVATSGARVDVQPSQPVQLFLNGRDRGLYRAMPAKDPAWVRSLDGAGAIDLLEGPAAQVIDGDRDHFERALQALLRGAPRDTLEALIDMGSLIDLACFDLYTGRADHDLNVRCWRPRISGGRWRWILFDMDLWAPVEENSVERFCSSELPETPYAPQLLAHPELRDALLARMIALLHSVLSPERAIPRVNDLAGEHLRMMQQDHERWSGEMTIPTPTESSALLADFVARRPALLLEHLGHQMDRSLRSFEVKVVPEGSGTIYLEDLPVTEDRAGITALDKVPLHFRAMPAEGMEFMGWRGAPSDDPLILVEPARVRSLEASFRPVGTSRRNGLEETGE